MKMNRIKFAAAVFTAVFALSGMTAFAQSNAPAETPAETVIEDNRTLTPKGNAQLVDDVSDNENLQLTNATLRRLARSRTRNRQQSQSRSRRKTRLKPIQPKTIKRTQTARPKNPNSRSKTGRKTIPACLSFLHLRWLPELAAIITK